MARLERIKKCDVIVNVVWECHLWKEIRSNPTMKSFFNNNDKDTHLHARDSLFGGRTECFKQRLVLTQEQLSDGWKINYLDFNR
jgi:hypothetical protein